MLHLARSGKLAFHHFPARAKIESRAKVDWVAKLVAVLQTLWFLATVISRLVEEYPVTLRAEGSACRTHVSSEGVAELPIHIARSFAIVVLAVFAGIHLAAWNYHFSSVVELWAWRAASLFTFNFGTAVIFLKWQVDDPQLSEEGPGRSRAKLNSGVAILSDMNSDYHLSEQLNVRCFLVQPGNLRRIWAHEISFLIRSCELG